MINHDLISTKLYRNLITRYPEQCERVFASKHCDIEPAFLGFVGTYLLLAKLIPRHFTVVDLGCAFAPQGFYFVHHQKYIGVDTGKAEERFVFENTEHVVCSIEDFLKKQEEDTSEIFAICNYVPMRDPRIVGVVFKNLYVFYPHGVPVIPSQKRGAR